MRPVHDQRITLDFVRIVPYIAVGREFNVLRPRLISALVAGGALLMTVGIAMLSSSVGGVSISLASPNLEIEPFEDFACLDCHTDQQRLTELAIEEEAPEALSSGPG